MLVGDWGFDCVAVSAPVEAAVALASRSAEVVAVIADISETDGHTGEQTYAAIAQVVGSAVPVIATSTHPGRTRRNGFTAVLAKPYDPDVLRGLLLKAIGPMPARKAC